MIKLEEIAKLAAVSTATASLALNNKPGVSNKTRNKVLAIADQYNYQPIRVHSKVKYNRTIRLVICTEQSMPSEKYTTYPVIQDLILSLDKLYQQNEDRLITTFLKVDNLNQRLLELERLVKTDFILIMATGLVDSQIRSLVADFKHIVFVDSMKHKINANFVSVNNYLGGYLAGIEAIKHKHTNIGYIRGQDEIQNFKDRYQGFVDALSEHHIAINSDYILTAENLVITNKLENYQAFDIKKIPTVFFCENDYIGLSAIKFFKENGLDVPRNVSIIGFDGLSDNHKLEYDITSIKFDTDEIARACYHATNNNETIKQIMVNPIFTKHKTLIRK